MYPAVECPWILWTFSMESLENVRIDNWNDVHGRSPQSPWKGPTVSVEKFHGICPLFSWKMSIVSMENVHRVHGNCPQYPWILWTFTMDIGKFPWNFSMETVDIFHGHCGQFPCSFWSQPSLATYATLLVCHKAAQYEISGC